MRFFVSTWTIFTTLFTANTVENVSGAEHEGVPWIELAIVTSNVLLIIVTFWLIRVTTREAMKEQSDTTNALIKVIKSLTRRNGNAKHRVGSGDGPLDE
jgi:hypothetical protein